MSAQKRWRLVCYDIRDPARWRRVYRIVCGRGERVQYSIFRCRLDDRQVEHLRWDLSRVIAPEDSLLIIDLCPTCAGHVISRNHIEGWQAQPPSFRVIGGASHSEQAPLDVETTATSTPEDPVPDQGDEAD